MCLTLILLTWKIRRAPNNADKWQMGFNSAFKMLNSKYDYNNNKLKFVSMIDMKARERVEV